MRQRTQIAERLILSLGVVVVLGSCQTAGVLEDESSRICYWDPALDSDILDAVVRDILTSPLHEDAIAFYGGLFFGSVGFDAETFPSGYHPVLKGLVTLRRNGRSIARHFFVSCLSQKCSQTIRDELVHRA